MHTLMLDKHVHTTCDFTENWSDSTYATGAGIKAISQAHNTYWAEVDGMLEGDYSEQQIHVFVLDSKTAFRKAVSQFSKMLDEGCPTVMFHRRMNETNDHRHLKQAAKALRQGGQVTDPNPRYQRSEEPVLRLSSQHSNTSTCGRRTSCMTSVALGPFGLSMRANSMMTTMVKATARQQLKSRLALSMTWETSHQVKEQTDATNACTW